MIVPSMNMAEVRREFERDYAGVLHGATKQAKELRKSSSFRFNKNQVIVKGFYSRNKNHWFIIHHLTSKETKFLFIVYWYDDKGIKAASDLACDYLLVIDGHFLKRYNFRLNLGIEIPEERLKHYFLRNNDRFTYDSKPEFNSTHMNVFSIMPSGVALGFQDNAVQYIWFKTFISEDMLYPNQKKTVKELRETDLAIRERERFEKNFFMYRENNAGFQPKLRRAG